MPGGCADSLVLYYCCWCLHQEKDTRVGIGGGLWTWRSVNVTELVIFDERGVKYAY